MISKIPSVFSMPQTASPISPAAQTSAPHAPGVAADRSGVGAQAPAPTFQTAVLGLVEAAGRAPDRKPDDPPSVMDRVLESGFQAYAEQIKAENLQKLREKILQSMGLTPEDLENMPFEQREAIADMVAKELERRMMALAELNDGQKTRTAMMTHMSRTIDATHITATVTHVGRSSAMDGRAAAMGSTSSGLGPLLALQDIELAKARAEGEPSPAPGKNDQGRRDTGSELPGGTNDKRD